MLSIDLFEFLQLPLFTVEDLNDIHSGDLLLEKRIQIGDGISDVVEGDFDFLLKDICGYDQ